MKMSNIQAMEESNQKKIMMQDKERLDHNKYVNQLDSNNKNLKIEKDSLLLKSRHMMAPASPKKNSFSALAKKKRQQMYEKDIDNLKQETEIAVFKPRQNNIKSNEFLEKQKLFMNNNRDQGLNITNSVLPDAQEQSKDMLFDDNPEFQGFQEEQRQFHEDYVPRPNLKS